MKVNGNAKFENGRLITPYAKKEITVVVRKRKPSSRRRVSPAEMDKIANAIIDELIKRTR